MDRAPIAANSTAINSQEMYSLYNKKLRTVERNTTIDEEVLNKEQRNVSV
jgi:hypothetical protein